MTLRHVVSPYVSTLQASLASNIMFIASSLFSPTPSLSFGLQSISQPRRCILHLSLVEPHTHLLTLLSSSLWTLDANFCSCIWKIAMLLRIDWAKVIHPTLDRQLDFHPSNRSLTLCKSLLWDWFSPNEQVDNPSSDLALSSLGSSW